MSKRIKISQKDVDALMYKCRHICCICQQPHKNIEIHHIDGNRINNEINNLVVLCRDCHSKVSSNEGLGRKYTVGEVKKYKDNWESKCKDIFETKGQKKYEDWDEDSVKIKIEDYNEVLLIKGHEHVLYSYYLEKDAEIKITFECDLPLNVYFQNKKDYNKWINHTEVKAYEYIENSLKLKKFIFTTTKNGELYISFVNDNDEDVEIHLKIKIWVIK